MSRRSWLVFERFAPPAALALAAVAVAVVLLSSGESHTVHVRFQDAGQLVGGDLVTVAGHQVGTVSGITLSPDGLADVELTITDPSIWPLRAGTRAEIRQLSLTGVANRFVGLTLAGSGAPISDGGTIGPENTKGIVDLDTLLDSLTPRVRSSLKQILKTGAYAFSGSTAAELNRALRYVSPSLSQVAALGRQVVADRFALERLIQGSATVAASVAARSADLAGAVNGTAAVFGEIAGRRAELADSLVRTAPVLAQARRTLADLDVSLRVVNPALSDLRPNAAPAAALLRAAVPAAAGLGTTVRQISALVTPSERALEAFAPAGRRALPGLTSLTRSLTGFVPILSGLRPYLPDLVDGFFTAIAGSSGGLYDANGHYARINSVFVGPQESLTGVLGVLGGLLGRLSPLTGYTTGHFATCPGGGAPPSADGSSPWSAPDTLPAAGTLCRPADDQR